MGLWSKIVDVGGEILGGAVDVVKTFVDGVEIVIDLKNKIVRIGAETFREAPIEVFFPGLQREIGLLKNEIADEFIYLSKSGIIPGITVWVDGALWLGKVLGVVKYRTMREDELEIARYVFQDSLKTSGIKLTNLAGIGGRPFAVPGSSGAVINLGKAYVDNDHIQDLPTLIHELTHAWQIQRAASPELFICNGILVQTKNELGDTVYDYEPGSQWSGYNLEQQAAIVEDWFKGRDNFGRMALDPERFRYVNGNVRPGKRNATTASPKQLTANKYPVAASIRKWLEEANAGKRLSEINPPRPRTW